MPDGCTNRKRTNMNIIIVGFWRSSRSNLQVSDHLAARSSGKWIPDKDIHDQCHRFFYHWPGSRSCCKECNESQGGSVLKGWHLRRLYHIFFLCPGDGRASGEGEHRDQHAVCHSEACLRSPGCLRGRTTDWLRLGESKKIKSQPAGRAVKGVLLFLCPMSRVFG